MAEELQHKEWSGKTDGQPWMQRSLIAMFRVMPLGLLYGVMALVVPFYMLFNRKGYRAMFQFFRKRFSYGCLKSFWNVYKNHFRFGQVILDRFAVYAGKKFEFIFDGYELYDVLEKEADSFLILSSHIGNYEMAGYSLIPKQKTINILAFSGETQTVMDNRERVFSQNNIRMILVKNDLSHLFALNSAINKGDIISMMADRIFSSKKNQKCQFLGETTLFPLGPFSLAVQKDLKVLAVFVMKESMKKYHIYIKEIGYDHSANKNDKIAQVSQNFVCFLEEIVRQYPVQWFNYFDFWQQ